MKFTIVCLFAVVAVVLARPQSKYTDKYDNINLKEVLANKRLFNSYVACVLDKGKCTNEGKELKSHIQEGLDTGCAKCTETQMGSLDEVFGHLINEEPGIWSDLKAKFDPKGIYAAKYEKELKVVTKN